MIRNEEAIQQVVNFDNCKFGRNLYPNRTDLEIEFNGKLFFMAQFRWNKTPLEQGVRLLFKRKCDMWQKAQETNGPRAFALHCTHWTKEGDIDAGNAYVHGFYVSGSWHYPKDIAPPEVDPMVAFKNNQMPDCCKKVKGFIEFWKNRIL